MSNPSVLKGYQKECFDVEQTLGIALKYPRYMDDQKAFPGTTDADGVCVGENTPASIAMEAAQKIIALEARVKELEETSISKTVFDNMAAELIQAQRAQISIFDMDYPPRAEQGSPNNSGGMLDLLTAEDVNRWIDRIQGLTAQVVQLKAQLARTEMQRDGMYSKVDSMEQMFVAHVNEHLEDRRVLDQHIVARERIARRAINMIINTRERPITPADVSRAIQFLAMLDPSTTPQAEGGMMVTNNTISGFRMAVDQEPQWAGRFARDR